MAFADDKTPDVSSEATLRSRTLAADAIGVPLTALAEDAAIGTLDAWDSLAHMRLLLAIEEDLGRELTTEEAAGILSLTDVEKVLKGSGPVG